VIPEGEYGGGTVMVWDTGRWVPRGDPKAGYRDGHLKFSLQGQKLKGNWSLIRTRNGPYSGREGREAWLLAKETDEFAQPDNPIVDTAAQSAVSGRTIEEIAQARERVWQSNRQTSKPVATKKNRTPRRNARDDRPAEGRETIAGVAVSNPDKLYFPEAGITKRDLARYYESVAPWILPPLERRPLSLVRCPDGWSAQCFYQKNADRSVHEAVTRVEVPG